MEASQISIFIFLFFFLELYSDKFISSRGFFKNKLSILALFFFFSIKNNKNKVPASH